MVALACQVLDAVIEESGRELPVLQLLRKSVYPSIFMHNASPEYGDSQGKEPEARKSRFEAAPELESEGTIIEHPLDPYTGRTMWFESDAEQVRETPRYYEGRGFP